MKRRFFALLLALAITAALIPTAFAAAFTDVPEGAWYADAVEWASRKGYAAGTSDTTFSPNTDCTRAQCVTFLWRAHNKPEPKSTVSPFTDVTDPNAYYYKAVLWAVEEGITTGTSATTFSPNAVCTRAQAVTFLWRAAEKPEAAVDAPFTDVKDSDQFAGAVAWAYQEGIAQGKPGAAFAPSSSCSRATIVTFLYRAAAEG